METRRSYNGPKRPSEKTFVFGIHPVAEALNSGKNLDRIVVSRAGTNERLNKLVGQARAQGVPIKMVPKAKLDSITLKNHQGIVAFLSPITYQPLEEIVMGAYENGESPILIAADGITDVRNLGAIARSAECFGVHGLIIPERGSASITDGAIKSSSGALLRLPVCRVPKITEALKFLNSSGVECIALSEKAESSIDDNKVDGPFCLVMGDEGLGVSKEAMNYCDTTLRIPMKGNTASLNVSVSAGIAIYQLQKKANS
ncbi:MAG: 23S rRNA (guanosine(2251)-2'-O)-methyltransferase RlmB [Euryarchaeota archaeon]|nr:23S rRNA (guanosine(2251)-2'-O)-methyltransferase RlmB [Euryarchaeota archaeon]|tara:strand:+ start:198 stop:971 length:774 start_codon:yes stop_codon:yes gene_type:complete